MADPPGTTAAKRMDWALRAPVDDPATKLTLVMLTDHADESGLAYPRVNSVAARIRKSDRQAQRCLDRLEDSGYIERLRLRSEGRLRGYLYRVLVPGSCGMSAELLPQFASSAHLPEHWTERIEADTSSGHECRVEEPSTGHTRPLDHRTHVSGQEPPTEEPPTEDQPLLSTGVDTREDSDAGFEQFWEQWPRRNGKKIGKEDARKRWRKLGMGERRAAWLGAVNYADACARRLPGVGAQDAWRWLRDRRWVDWQTPAQDQPNGRVPACQQVSDHGDASQTGSFTP